MGENVKEIRLFLKGLNCANCANKIEAKTKNFENVIEAELNFAKSSLVIKVNENADLKSIEEEVTQLVKKLEPHVQVINMKNKDIKRIKTSNCKCNDEKCSIKNDSNEDNHDLHKLDSKPKEMHEEKTSGKVIGFIKDNIRLIIGVILYIIAMVLQDISNISIIIFLISYIFVGKDVLITAFRNILRGEVFDENFLMSVATLGAISIGQYPEGIAVMVFYEIGEMFQGYAVEKSRKSISQLMNIRPDYANALINEQEVIVSPEEVKINDFIIVKPGERIPLDGVVEEGNSFVDTSALTGEAVPRKLIVGDEALAGCINNNGLLKIRVTKLFEESTVARILDLVENASSKKAKTEKFITKFARIYTPIVVLTAVAVALIPPMILGWNEFSVWLYRALIFLVVSCPCALVVSIPLGMFAGLGGASKKGILIKGGNYLEAIKNIDTVVFDKTGTLTKGVFKVTEVKPVNLSKEELLEIAAIAESNSNHPIAQSLIKEYNKSIDASVISEYEEIAGHGISVKINEKLVLVGNKKLMDTNNITSSEVTSFGTVIHVAKNNEYIGYIVISDEIKETSKKAIKELKSVGIKRVIMLTGDRKVTGDLIGKELSIDKVYSELLPDQKVEKLEEILKVGKVAFVGDGINDAPVLARADIGISMGGIGSDAAIEASDVVLMNDDPMAIVDAIKTARKTNKILWQNIIFSLGVKLFVLILGVFGFTTMWAAVFADVGVTVLAVINSYRCLR